MFDSITDLAGKLAKTGYFIDPVMIQVVFLAAKLQKPLLLEGPAGSGKCHPNFVGQIVLLHLLRREIDGEKKAPVELLLHPRSRTVA